MRYIEEGIELEKAHINTDKKNVFLIGDSIRLGYCEFVKEELQDVANVVYPDENCKFTQNVLVSIYDWATLCDPKDVAVVQFNCGHWDIAHWRGEAGSLNTVDVYAGNIARIVRVLKAVFPNAKIIFATTTAMNPNGSQGMNPRTNEEIEEYNRAATEACEEDILINDLYAVTLGFGEEMYADYCHQNEKGAKLLGKAVSDCIRELLF